ncbi:MFS transporter [Nocardia cyriacigeorgica]|nr:MFS transporter [Nocardia cyriacigeorgica]
MLPIVLTATFVQLLDVTIVQVALPVLQHELDTTGGVAQLVITGYTLPYACIMIPAARLGDRYGYRRMFIIGMGVFTLGSLAAGAAPTITMLIAARVLQGLGSGVLAPQVLSIIQTALPATRRPRAMGWYGSTMAIASLLGPIAGGLLLAVDAAGLGWRLLFVVNLPIGLFTLVRSRRIPITAGADQRPIPLLSAALIVAGAALLIYPLAVGHELGWPTWTAGCLTAAAGLLAGFVGTQVRGRRPLLDPRVLRARMVRRGLAAVFVFNAAVPSFTLLLMHYLQSSVGLRPLGAAILGARSAPWFTHRYRASVLAGAASSLAAVMRTLALLVATAAPLGTWLPILAVGGGMFGIFTASVFGIILATAPESAAGSVSGLLPTAQQLGGTVGITLAGLCYFAVPALPATAFGHTLIYEAAILFAAAILALAIRTPPHSTPDPPHPTEAASHDLVIRPHSSPRIHASIRTPEERIPHGRNAAWSRLRNQSIPLTTTICSADSTPGNPPR